MARPHQMTLLLLLLALAPPMERVEVPRAEEKGALCNDGTPASYYLREGRKETWVLFLAGGGMCTTVAECQDRSKGLASSEGLLPSLEGGGILSSDPEANPDFFDASVVFVPYCSSDLWSGDRAASEATGWIHFRGSRILEGVVEDLRERGLGEGGRVLLGGSSAGGFGVLSNLDRLAAALPGATVKGINDGGWFMLESPHGGGRGWVEDVEEGQILWAGRPDDSCARAESPGKCHLAAFAGAHLETPLFVYQDQRDNLQLGWLGLKPPINEGQKEFAIAHMALMRASLGGREGVFSTARGWHTAVHLDSRWGAEIDGLSLRDAVANWFFGRAGPTKAVE